MKKCRTIIPYVIIAIVVVGMVIISGLQHIDQTINTPPTCNEIMEQYNNHYDDIEIVANYLAEAPYESIYITDMSGNAWADFSNIQLDKIVHNAINNLIKSGDYIHFYKSNNTVRILQWRGLRDIGCGIAYSLNGMAAPEIPYVTQLEELPTDNWYYYVMDYNLTRGHERGQGDGSPRTGDGSLSSPKQANNP